MSQQTVALAAVLALLFVPALPPEHVHRGKVGGHTPILVHRHLAAHTSPDGAHMGHRGSGDGAPVWLADPGGLLNDSITLHADAAVVCADGCPPKSSRAVVGAACRGTLPTRPAAPFGLRAPPARI